MSACEACLQAETNPRTGLTCLDCKECAARSLANGPAFRLAVEANAITPGYRSVLQYYFGDEWLAWHEKVKGWAVRMGAKA